MPRGSTAPPAGGNTAHSFNSVMNHCYTFHAGATVVAVKGGINGTISGAGMAQSDTTGLTSTNQGRYVTLASDITLSGEYSIMFRAKLTGNPFYSTICGRPGGSFTSLVLDASDSVDTVVVRDDTASNVIIDYADAPKVNLRDYCLVVGTTQTKFYSKAAADTTWTLEDTITRASTAFTLNAFGDAPQFSTGLYGELHYFQTFTEALTATDLLDFADPYDVSTPDLDAPTVGSCSIPTAGTYITVPFTDDSLLILPSAIVGDGGFTVAASGGSVTVANVLRTASAEFRLLLSRIIITGETITFSYAGSTVTDSASTPNELAAITDQAVTNNSTQVPGEGALDSTVVVSGILTRPVGDDQPVIFSWPTPGATLSGTRGIGITGIEAIPSERFIFAYTASGEDVHYLVYNAADRPAGTGTVVYRITDGTIVRKIILNMIEITTNVTLSSTSMLSPVTQRGALATIIIGDDYLATYGRSFDFAIDPPTGFVLGTSTCKFGGAAEKGSASWSSTGTITLSGSQWILKFNLTKTQTAALTEGLYRWSVEVKSADLTEHTVVRWGEGARVVGKQT